MNLYIQIENGQPVAHPYIEDNLKDAWQVAEITDALLAEKGFARFERRTLAPGLEVVSEDGYEMCDDGVVRDKLTTRELSQEEKVDLWVRRPRNYVLSQTDWTQMPDAPLTAEKKAEFAAFRQQLRDMTTLYANIQDPAEIVPPTMPTK